MSNIIKAIIPLIDENISLDYITDPTFVGCYTEDINRPYLDDHIFLMYEWDDNKSTKIFYKIKSLKSFYGYKIMYINGKSYIIYTFTSNPLINRVKTGAVILRDVNKLRILRFWQFTDDWVTNNIMRGTIICDPSLDTVPEEDYLYEDDEDD